MQHSSILNYRRYFRPDFEPGFGPGFWGSEITVYRSTGTEKGLEGQKIQFYRGRKMKFYTATGTENTVLQF